MNKGREGLGLIGSAGGEIFNQAGIEIHLDLIAVPNIPGGLVAFQNRQADVDGVAIENPGKGGGDDAGDAAGFDGDGSVFPGRAAAEILVRDHDVAGADFMDKILVDRNTSPKNITCR